MAPQTRPFDEVAKDVFANEGNAQIPPTQHVVPQHVDHREREGALLRHLICVHQDAAAFYKTAALSTHFSALEPQLAELENIHLAIVDNLGTHLRSSSDDPQNYAEAETAKEALIFGDLMYLLSSDNFPVRDTEAAERESLQMMEDALEQDISPETQAFLAEQIGILSRAYDQVQDLSGSARTLS